MTMVVAELMEHLAHCNPKARVYFDDDAYPKTIRTETNATSKHVWPYPEITEVIPGEKPNNDPIVFLGERRKDA